MTMIMADINISIVQGDKLSDAEPSALKALLDEAYETDFAPYLALFDAPVHALAWENDQLLSHACWITRWLQAGDGPLWRTAYVEAVATAIHARRRGLASQVMRALVDAVSSIEPGYEIAALSPSDDGYYARLGWERWQGPLWERTTDGIVASPEDEEVMIYRLPATPDLDLNQPLSIEGRDIEVW